MKATVIPAKPIRRNIQAKEPTEMTRVAAYARVSTLYEEQESSYEVQCDHYTRLIDENPEWEMTAIYADEGITGLSTLKRDQFNQMIADCEAGKIDMIITKSISRFARNTLDALTFVRKLRALNIPIIFEKEGINSMDSSGELALTILSSLAQQESESISRNVQMGIRFHYQEGKVCSGHQNILGYKRSAEGKLEIVPEEADMVRKVFRLYLDGFSPKHIGEIMLKEGKLDRRGVQRSWRVSTVQYLLKNEKYMGDLRLQKYYTQDFLMKKTAVNYGQVPQYYVEDSHEPILPKEIFYRVQEERRRRGKAYKRCSHTNALSGKVICKECGQPYVRRKEDENSATYRCGSTMAAKYKTDIDCKNPPISEETLRQAVVDAFNQLPQEREELMLLKERLVWGPISQANMMLEDLEKKLKDLEREKVVVAGTASEAETEKQYEEVQNQIEAVQERKAEFVEKEMAVRNLLERIDALEWRSRPAGSATNHNLLHDTADNANDISPAACNDVDDFFSRTRWDYPMGKVTKFSEDETNKFVEKILVGEKIEVIFKGGVQIELERK